MDSSAVRAFEAIKVFLSAYSRGQTLYDSLEEEYIRLFISNRQGIPAPLYASCYVEGESSERAPLMGEPALAMQERFQSKGLSLGEDIGEPPDHLSIELEYLYFLLNIGWTNNDDQFITEASSFAADIMLPWVVKLEHGLAVEENPALFYPHLITLLGAFLRFIGTIESGF
ncbi:MAG: hypothetical protein C0407_17150 [Desulfobacca sp.]|nr:hypothetical protein [Desulfobacca sp.]